jgi:hypothetical protein
VDEQVHDGHRVAGRAQSGGEHHVADLAHGGRGEGFFDVVFGAADDGAEQQGDRPDDDHTQLRARRQGEDGAGSHDQVDPGGDHGGGVDERRDRGGAFHRVAQPGLQRDLGGLAAGGQQQQQPDRRQGGLAQLGGGGEHPGKRQGPDGGEHHHLRDRQADVADPVDHERFLGRRRG